jgi:SAM-dependent methyltransferase
VKRAPHFVRDYRRLMRTMRRRHTTLEGAVLRTTGAADLKFGALQLSILTAAGLGEKGYLIDVGCGSGRLGLALRSLPNIQYMGVDILPELITFAREKCSRPDWRFVVVEGLSIPESDDVADYVSFLSVITHLTPQESFQYLQDAGRTLKRGGKIVVSFLDRNVGEHRRLAGSKARQLAHRLLGDGVMNTLLNVPTMLDFGQRLGMETEFIPSPMGHSICVYTKA